MPKQKPHKGLRKRVKITATGKLVHKRAFGGHLMSGKSGKRRRNLRKAVTLGPADTGRLKKAMAL